MTLPEIYKRIKLVEGGWLLALALTWALVQWVAFNKFGVLISIDSEVYLTDAQAMIQGELPSGRSFMYLSYSALLAIIQWFGFDASAIVAVQLLTSLGAVFCAFFLAKHIHGSRWSGVVAALLYIVWIKIHQWNFVLYTDSLFCSMVVISFTANYLARSKWQLVIALGLLLFTIFIRPNGIGFGMAMLGYFMVKHSTYNNLSLIKKSGIAICFLFLFLVAVNIILGPYVDSFIASYQKAEIIYPNRQLFIRPSLNLVLPDQSWPPLIKLAAFAINNPIYFGKLFFLKAGLFIANVKPYFSWTHNLIIVTFLYPIYWFAYRGLRLLSDVAVVNFVVIYIGLQVAVVGLTSENWDGRFLIPILPFVFVLASGAVHKLIKSSRALGPR